MWNNYEPTCDKNELRNRTYTLHKNVLDLQVKRKTQNIIDLKAKHKTIKLLEDNIGENLDDLRYGNDFLDATPKA